MKYSEKMELLAKGVKWAEIKELEAEEAEEAKKAAEDAAKLAADEEAKKAAEKAAEDKSALSAAQEMIKELETKLSAKEDELTKLNKEFADLNNKQTVKNEPEVKESAADVMKQLFHPKSNKEEK